MIRCVARPVADALRLAALFSESDMANPEQVEIVKQGWAAFDAWREKNPGVQLDLVGANLHRVDLSVAKSCGSGSLRKTCREARNSSSKSTGPSRSTTACCWCSRSTA